MAGKIHRLSAHLILYRFTRNRSYVPAIKLTEKESFSRLPIGVVNPSAKGAVNSARVEPPSPSKSVGCSLEVQKQSSQRSVMNIQSSRTTVRDSSPVYSYSTS